MRKASKTRGDSHDSAALIGTQMEETSGRSHSVASSLVALRSGVTLAGGALAFVCAAVLGVTGCLGAWRPLILSEAKLLFALLSLLGICSVSLWVLKRRDGRLPLFDVGAVCAVVTALYFTVPILNFMAGGMAFTILSDNRLYVHGPSPDDLATLTWMAVGYLGGFCLVYVLARGRGYANSVTVRRPRRPKAMLIGVMCVGLAVALGAVEMVYSVSFTPSYLTLRAGIGSLTQLPYLLQQIMHNVRGIYLIAKLGLLLIVLLHWSKLGVRIAGLAWLCGEVVWAIVNQGARTDAVLLVLAAGLLYHRVVRPLTFIQVCAGGTVLFLAIVVFGAVRDTGVAITGLLTTDLPLLSMGNEFQSVFATGYDLSVKSEQGLLGEVPWTLYASELLMLIPSQLLPFRKLDPATWYLELLHLKDSYVGFVFGVLSQSVIGWGAIEIIGRGMVLATIFAIAHRWYVRRAAGFDATLVYLFLCVWSYYTVRATTLYILYFVVYRMIPFLLVVAVGEGLLLGVAPTEGEGPGRTAGSAPKE